LKVSIYKQVKSRAQIDSPAPEAINNSSFSRRLLNSIIRSVVR